VVIVDEMIVEIRPIPALRGHQRPVNKFPIFIPTSLNCDLLAVNERKEAEPHEIELIADSIKRIS